PGQEEIHGPTQAHRAGYSHPDDRRETAGVLTRISRGNENDKTGVNDVRKCGGGALIGAIVGVLFNLTAAVAEDYPSRPITLLHGFGVGGNADVIARIVAEGLSKRIGQPVVGEDRPGAGGNIAS